MDIRDAIPDLPPDRMRVLVIDDNPDDRILIEEALADSRLRFAVACAESPDDAIEALARAAFDAVLLDLCFPEGGGLDHLDRLRDHVRNAPILVMTGVDSEPLALEAVERGAQEYLVKGLIDPRALARTVAQAIYRQRRLEQLERGHRRLLHRADHDPLTGLANRAALDRRLAAIGPRPADRDGLTAVLFLDLDGFKAVNDERGHEAGDRVLRVVARRLESAVRRTDLVARIGGDEFVVVVPALDNVDEAVAVAGKIRHALRHPVSLGLDDDVGIAASIGIAVHPYDAADGARLMASADAAMYLAKGEGRNRIRLATGSWAGTDRRGARPGPVSRPFPLRSVAEVSNPWRDGDE